MNYWKLKSKAVLNAEMIRLRISFGLWLCEVGVDVVLNFVIIGFGWFLVESERRMRCHEIQFFHMSVSGTMNFEDTIIVILWLHLSPIHCWWRCSRARHLILGLLIHFDTDKHRLWCWCLPRLGHISCQKHKYIWKHEEERKKVRWLMTSLVKHIKFLILFLFWVFIRMNGGYVIKVDRGLNCGLFLPRFLSIKTYVLWM